MIEISVVIPLYNKEKEIARTLRSVTEQSCLPAEIIVVDDGSTDNGAAEVEKFAEEYSGPVSVRLIRKKNGGVCSARNRGIAEAAGGYVALLDADDGWDKDYLLEQARLIEDFPQAAMWGINFAELYDGKLIRELATGLPKGFRGIVDDYFGLPAKSGRVSDLFCSTSVVIRKDAFDECGMFDERIRYSEDIDMWWRIIAKYPVAFYDRYMAWYYYDAGNRAMERQIKLRYSLPYYVCKYASYKGNEPFYTFAQRWCAINLKKAYFGNDRENRADALTASRELDFEVLPPKYKLYFRLPHCIGRMVYQIKK